ncbi:Lar family restriction alleviation protein [Ruminococcus gauvreauii]|uniref:Lar family restriction alleviation protein n=1 Tax=Ruminococcus gauvreauii TaxID=438033 RepID=UPI0039842FBD
MNEIKLLPCPFCGGKAEFVRKPVKANGGWCDAVYVRCKCCDTRTNRILYSAKIHKNDSEYVKAAKAWNTRKPMERIVKQLVDMIDPNVDMDTGEACNNWVVDMQNAVIDECIKVVLLGGDAND